MSPAKLNRLDPTTLASNPRAALSSWEHFAPLVLRARALHPQPFSFQPIGSPGSIASKLRDAIRGAITFSYVPDVPALSLWWSEVIVKHDSTHVYIGPPTKAAIPKVQVHEPLSFDSLSEDELHAFCLLLSNSRISGPVVVRNAQRFKFFRAEVPNVFPTYSDGILTLL